MSSPPVLAADGLVVGYHGRGLLPPIDLAIGPGELWVLAGRNGSGKSTLLRTLLGLQPAIHGQVRRAPAAEVAYVPQRQDLDPIVPMRACDLVAEGLEQGWSFLRPAWGPARRAQVAEALANVGASALAGRAFVTLSEGQKQRVLLARALVSTPRLMVLDEPTSAMDLTAELEALALIDQVRRRLGAAVLLVSHHLPSAIRLADRLMFVDAEHQKAVVGAIDQVTADPVFRSQFAGVVRPDGSTMEEDRLA